MPEDATQEQQDGINRHNKAVGAYNKRLDKLKESPGGLSSIYVFR
jgi:hypothetical protein